MIQMEKDWDRATATFDYIMIPNKPPVRRKHRNVWTDADYSEITAQSKCQPKPYHLSVVQVHDVEKPPVAIYAGGDPSLTAEEQLRAVHEANQLKRKIYIP